MKKILYQEPEDTIPLRIAAEPEVLYIATKKIDEFPVSRFRNLSEKLPFTQLEWADILHISDRTLHRYLKDEKHFEGLYAEHLYQLENMADLGLLVFGNSRSLEAWLRTPREVLGEVQDFSTLRSFWGVKLICNELGRMEHGIYI
nr:antitoxin Xre/MbcA/ParS toxin-binding domain-containing protein [uncultured Dyadobacter sp.]